MNKQAVLILFALALVVFSTSSPSLLSVGPGNQKTPPAAAIENPQTGIEPLTECLVLPPLGRFGRSAIHQDAVAAQVVAGKWLRPKAGDTVTLPGGQAQKWEAIKANKA